MRVPATFRSPVGAGEPIGSGGGRSLAVVPALTRRDPYL